jgi:hypothetical protein
MSRRAGKLRRKLVAVFNGPFFGGRPLPRFTGAFSINFIVTHKILPEQCFFLLIAGYSWLRDRKAHSKNDAIEMAKGSIMRASLQCPDCYSMQVRRSHHRNKLEIALSSFRIFPFRCECCLYRFWRATGRTQDLLDKLMAAVLSR